MLRTTTTLLSAAAVLSSWESNAFSFMPPSSTRVITARTPTESQTAKRSTALMSQNDAWENGLMGKVAAAALSVAVLTTSTAAFADGQTKEFRFPPIDYTDKTRCTLNSSKMGQANAARDKLYDLRQCNLSGKDATGYDLSGVIMTKTDMSGAKLQDSQFSKAFLHDSNFDGADFTNAVVDRASFKGSTLRGTLFVNTVLTGTSFEDADVENADFTEAYIGDFDIRKLCKNPTLKGENPVTGADTKLSAGCGLR